MLKRLLVALLLLSMLLGTLGGCKKKKEGDSTDSVTTAPSDGVETSILDTLPEKDMNGKTVRLLTLKGYNDSNYLINKESTGEPITEVSIQRTLYIQDKYNVTLELVEDTESMGFTDIVRSNHMSGTNEYDIYYPHPTTGIVPLMVEGCFANLYGLQNIDLKNEWYNQNQVNNYLASDKLYIVTSDYSIVGQGTAALVFNKDMYAEQSFNYDVYAAVENGTWTLDALETLIKGFSVSEDGTGTYGLQFHTGYTDRFLYAFGEVLSTKDANNNFVIGYNTTRLSDVAERLHALVQEHSGVYNEIVYNSTFPTSKLFTNFKEGNSLFITFDVGAMHHYLRDLSFTAGYLPLPKFNETQEDYYSFCASGFFAIPSVSPTVEDSALILDALSRYSNVYMKPQFFETVLVGRMANSAEDYAILEKIHEDKIYDFAFTADSDEEISKMLYKTIIELDSSNVSGYLRKKENYINQLFETMNALS